VRFSTFEYGYYYEKSLTAAFQQVLSESVPGSTKHHVIDVGGNIGWFSLLSAAHGAQVTMFEPNPHNNLRACESMRLNGWLPCSSSNGGCLNPQQANLHEFHSSNIHIYPYGISDKEGNLFFEQDEFNPGKDRVVDYEWNMTTPLRVVSLDFMAKELGWLESDISILKVDVEGAELGVFQGAKGLLRSKRVHNLFMEGGGKGRAVQRRFRTVLALLIDAGYKVHKIGGWRGPEYPMDAAPSGANIVEYHYDQCMAAGQKSKQCNLWWRPQ
jgi:FkbM family methyltransferase